MSGRTSINGMPKCFAASRPIGSYLQVEDRTTFASVVSQSFNSLASSFWSTMYGNLRGLCVRLQLRTPSISRKIIFIRTGRSGLRSICFARQPFSALENGARRTDTPGSVGLLGKFVGHFLVVFKCCDRFPGPGFKVGIIANLRIPLEEVDRIFVRGLLIGSVLLVEIGAVQTLELVEFRLMRAVHRGRQFGLHLAAGNHPLQFGGSLGVVGHHLSGKCLRGGVAFGLGELAR